MSKFLKEPYYGPRALEIQWMNGIVTSHALFCGCEKPFYHLQDILKQQQTRCLFIGEEDSLIPTTKQNGEEKEDPLDEGILEQLFADDMEDDKR